MSYITKTTKNKREQVKRILDKFSTFTWDGLDSFDNFGTFIINENREGLKFYNGPSFSNEYTSPQFANNKEFVGVNFEQQKISFKIGVYWISIEDYRKFLEWLSPYKISKLTFSFNDKWYYQLKLSGREESTRYILGYEDGEPRYYSEMTLNFEVQGEPCLYSVHEFMWYKDEDDDNIYKIDTNSGHDWPIVSDLPVDLEMNWTCSAKSTTGSIEAMIYYNEQQKQLFKIVLQNLTVEPDQSENPDYHLNISYSSKDGLIYFAFGGEKYKLLNLLTTTTSGKEIVSSLEVNKLQLPGLLINSDIDYSNFRIVLTLEDMKLVDNYSHNTLDNYNGDDDMNIQIHSSARTTIV